MTATLTALILGLVFVSLLLSMLRISLQLLSPLDLRRLAERASGRAAVHVRRYEKSPLAIQIPLQITHQAAMVTAGVLLTALLYREAAPFPILVALAVLWSVLLLFNHILPRLIAHGNPERVARLLLPPMIAISSLLGPFGDLISWLVVGRGSVALQRDEDERREELDALIDVGKDAGLLGKDDAKLVKSLVDFGDTVLREVMTPRVDMVCVASALSLPELAQTFVREGFARMPVYQDKLESIEGFVHVKDVLSALTAQKSDVIARDLKKPVTFEPETKRVAQVLRELQAGKRQMAICIDEYGSVSGLVTIEDLLEEIVGEIHDEYDEVSADVSRDDRGALVLAGKTPIERLQTEIGKDGGEVPELESDDFETVSGLVLSLLGRIPQKGEQLEHAGLRFEVLEADKRRILKLRVQPVSRGAAPRSAL